MLKHSLCILSSIAYTVQRLVIRAFVIVSILSLLADALVRVGISRCSAALKSSSSSPEGAVLQLLPEGRMWSGRQAGGGAAFVGLPALVVKAAEAGSEPGPGSEPGVAEAESSESSTACELPGPRARHRTRCCVGCSSGAVVWYDPFDTKTHHCYLLRQTLWSRGRGPMRGLRHSEVRATYLPMLALPSRSVLPRLCVTASVPFPRLRLRCSSVSRGLVRVHPLKQNLTCGRTRWCPPLARLSCGWGLGAPRAPSLGETCRS